MVEAESGGGSSSLVKALEWAMSLDPSDGIKTAESKRSAYPDEDLRGLAERIVSSYARKGAAEGFLTGLGSNPLVAVPSAVADVAFMLRFYAGMTAVVGYLSNPKYFDDPDWKSDALLMLAGPKAVSRLLHEVGVAGGKQTSKVLIKKYLSKEVLRAIKRVILKWFGKKVTQRAIIAKAVPVIGGLIGGSWNYIEISTVGKRIIRYHFDDVLT
jgi:hypothetical protein